MPQTKLAQHSRDVGWMSTPCPTPTPTPRTAPLFSPSSQGTRLDTECPPPCSLTCSSLSCQNLPSPCWSASSTSPPISDLMACPEMVVVAQVPTWGPTQGP